VEKVRVEPLPGHPLSLGSTVVFSVTVRNVGSSDLAGLAVTDLYDPGCLTYVNAPGMPTQVLAPGHLVWELSSLSMGDALSWEVFFQATAPCTQTVNCAIADAEGPEASLVHDEMCIEFPIEPAEPAVSVRKIIVEPLELPGVGDLVHFAVIVQNIGNTPLTGVPLQDTFDADCLEYVSAMPAPDFLSPATGLLRWNNLGPLGPGEMRVVRLFLRVKFTCRPSTNCALSTSEDVNGLEVTGDTCIDVFAGEERRLFLPLVLRG
jgi:uncharacterized repeat protein (TIGR01451 family)